jgi:NNP family nitrate/nitrite transporter-like MFS transporter
MSEGATYSVVPFINRRALGSVAGIVGAGGNVGAVLGGFLFKNPDLAWSNALLILGGLVTLASFASFAVTFNESTEREAREGLEAALMDRRQALEFAPAS